MEEWEEFLNQIYFDAQHPGAFAGPRKLQQILRKNNIVTSIKTIKTWLANQDSYSLLRPLRYKFKRRRVITTGIDDLWDADLADVTNLAQHNDDVNFWLVVIDVFSRYLWIVPVKSKHHSHMVGAFKTVFQQTTRRPKNLRTDKGTEFKNRAVRKILKDENINAFVTKNETKANYAERVIRTLKGLTYRYFLHNQTYVYQDVLQKLVNNYNKRPHRSLNGLSPAEINKTNEAKVWKSLYIDTVRHTRRTRKKSYKFSVGDQVRISHLKYLFQRDYHQKWTEEIFKVTNRIRKEGFNLYTLSDLINESVDGYFYEAELQHITKDTDTATFRVEKVLKQRRHNGQQELLVKWMGWPIKFNSWVDANAVKRY